MPQKFEKTQNLQANNVKKFSIGISKNPKRTKWKKICDNGKVNNLRR